MNDKKWTVLEESSYFEFKLFSARRSRRVNPRTAKPFDFFLMSGLDWVTTIALTAKDEVILVQQFRHGSDTVTIECPGGAVEAGEDPKNASGRELAEETGYVAKKIEPLGMLYPNPAMQGMKLHCFLATGCEKQTGQTLDPGEDIKILVKPLSETIQMIQSGEFNHALCVAAFGLWKLRNAG